MRDLKKKNRKRIISSLSSFAIACSLFSPTASAVEMNQIPNVPKLLITELVPDTSNVTGMSADAFEFIEVYNNTSETINFKDYNLVYRYPAQGSSGDVIWSAGEGDILIPSKSSVVFWVMNTHNQSLTQDDFNANYGTALQENANLFRVNGGGGMANGSARDILLKDKNGNEIVITSYQNDEQTVANKGIFYQYPTDGSIQMVMGTAGVEAASPGAITTDQVPAEAEAPANLAPQINHVPVTALEQPQDVNITAQVKDDGQVSGVNLFYKAGAGTDFTKIEMTAGATDENGLTEYAATIPQAAMEGASSVEYYLEASDEVNIIRNPAEPTNVHTIQIGEAAVVTGPYLQISEVVFNSRDYGPGMGESYEYVELYNNSNQPIPLNQYKLLYGNWSPSLPYEFQIAGDKVLQPGETVVLWNNKTEQGATVEDFIRNYGGIVRADQIVNLEPSNGFVNTGARNFTLVTKTGEVVSKVEYNLPGSSTDQSDNKDHTSVTYKAESNDVLMVELGSKQTPTPGSILPAQIPSKNVELPTDFLKPIIKHMIPMGSTKPQDLTVKANVTDDHAVAGVTLFYKKKEEAQYTSIPMTAGTDGQFSAVIPEEAMVGTSKLQYFFEATDGTNINRSNETEGKLYEIQIFTSDKSIESELMITEILPANTGTEKYEYLEIYNNTNKDVNLEDYKLLYENRGGASTSIDIPTDFVLPATETAVIWLQSYDSKDESITDFNAHFGTNLEASKVLPVNWSGIGLPDAEEGRLLIAPDAAYPISHAAEGIISQAWFSVTQDDAMDGKSVVYEYAKDGNNRMFLRGSGAQPTPGTLLNAQVPETPMELTADEENPVITHEPLTGDQENVDFTLEAAVTDHHDIKQVSLYFKRKGASEYTRVNMLRSDVNKYVSEMIKRYQIANAEYIDYYFTASDGSNVVSTLDNGAEPYRMHFKQPKALELNITDGQFIRGTQIVEGRSQSTGQALSMTLDGQPVTTQPAMPEDAYILFQAYDMQASFNNGLFINDELASIMPGVSNYNSAMLTLPKNMFTPGENKITMTSGNGVDPKGLADNNDDYKLQNVEIVMWNGEKVNVTAQIQSDKGSLTPVADPKARTTINDTFPQIHYTVILTEDLFPAVTSTLDTTTLPDGEHQLQLTGANDEAISVKAIVDNTAPVIERLSVEDGKSYKEQVSLNVQASDVTSGIEEITALLDGEPVELPASPYLENGEHTLEVKVTDKAGNTTTQKVTFTTMNQHPDKPTESEPKGNAENNGNGAQLSVKVTDPDGDKMDVSFYKAYKHDFAGDSKIQAYSNSVDREPPLELVPSGEEAFSNEAITKVKEKDGQYFATDSDGQFPYHRFDFTIKEELSPEDEVEVVWDGHSLSDRQVTMYTWNFNTNKWERATSGIGSEDFQLRAKVNIGDMVRDNVLHVLIQDLFPSPEDVDFTFAWVSDTQYYSDSYPFIYKKMMEYIVNQKDEKKIIYSIHTGDIVDDWDRPDEWAVADEAMKMLDDAGMNYGVVAGNHDVHFTDADYSEYYKYFGRDRFENQPTFGDDLGNNRDHYDLVSQNGQDFLIMYLGWDIREETIKWANDVLKKYPNRQVIIATHSYITPSGAYGGDGWGEKIWTDIVAPNKNVFMVLCGHFHGVAYNVKHAPDGRTVVEMLADYQSGLEGGGGYIRFLQFDLDNQKIHVNTYSPYKEDENFFDEPGKDEFDIDYQVRPVAKQVATDYIGVNVYTNEEIGTRKNVENGVTATVPWNNLPRNSFFSWYTVVKDAFGGKTVSDVWRFKTGEGVNPPSNGDNGSGVNPPGEKPDVNEEKGNLVVELNGNETSAAIPVGQVGGQSLEVHSGKVKMKIDSSVLKNLHGEADLKDAQYEVSLTPIEVKEGGHANIEIAGEVYEFTVAFKTADGKLVKAAEVNGGVEITVPYSKDGVDEDLLGVYYFNESTGNWEYVGGQIDKTDNQLTVQLEHLSKYAVLEYEKKFDDISESHWAFKTLQVMTAKHIVNGTTETTFSPGKTTTRAQFVAMMVRALGLENSEETPNFSDVKNNDWFAKDVATAVNAGLINGLPDGTFAPNKVITREQMAIIIVRAYEFKKGEIQAEPNGFLIFKDHNQMDAGAKEFIGKASAAGLMAGPGEGKFAPKANANRVQAAQTIYNLLEALK